MIIATIEVENLEEFEAFRKAWDEARKADACTSCAFFDCDPWEMPCRKCRRNSKDYYRPKGSEEK